MKMVPQSPWISDTQPGRVSWFKPSWTQDTSLEVTLCRQYECLNVAAIDRNPQCPKCLICVAEDLQTRSKTWRCFIQIKMPLESQTLFFHHAAVIYVLYCHQFTDVLCQVMKKSRVMEMKFLSLPNTICVTTVLSQHHKLHFSSIIPGIMSYKAFFPALL